eukprot:TRINITY_DN5557_c0_g1_i1.p1 TRINITY_DN5557_c0_g1~~TRINITY_DN5557_c0_g1_i1.p1  ORF type:complete len:872 (+),score=212.71 TRINITY_DN5557_c0_g1_i1:68-2683(+)
MDVVRPSRFRHVFGSTRKNSGYEALKPRSRSGEGRLLKVNSKIVAVQWETSGFGALAILPVRDSDLGNKIPAKMPTKVPLIEAYKSLIQDFDLHPFDETLVATADSSTIRFWRVPETGIKEQMTTPTSEIAGTSSRRISTLQFHPTVNHLLNIIAKDGGVHFIDVEKGADVLSVATGHTDTIQSLSWNWAGSQFVTSGKDRAIKLVDPRAKTAVVAQIPQAHESTKGCNVIWLGKRPQLLSNGFAKSGERKVSLWDVRRLDAATPLTTETLATSPALMMSFYDPSTEIVFMAGKGDNSIRYYEIVDDAPFLHYLDQYTSALNQTDLSIFPKKIVDVAGCEVYRFAKLSKDKIEHLMFQVPRKGRDTNVFHEDLFECVVDTVPTIGIPEWTAGKSAEPIVIPVEDLIPADSKSIYEIDPQKQLEKEDRDILRQEAEDNGYGVGPIEGLKKDEETPKKKKKEDVPAIAVVADAVPPEDELVSPRRRKDKKDKSAEPEAVETDLVSPRKKNRDKDKSKKDKEGGEEETPRKKRDKDKSSKDKDKEAVSSPKSARDKDKKDKDKDKEKEKRRRDKDKDKETTDKDKEKKRRRHNEDDEETAEEPKAPSKSSSKRLEKEAASEEAPKPSKPEPKASASNIFAAAAAAAAAKRGGESSTKSKPEEDDGEKSDEEEKEPSAPMREGYLPETFPDGSKFQGYFKENKRNGQGEFSCAPDKSKYIGEWKDNQKHGEGKLILQDGSEWSGKWQNGARDTSASGGGKFVFDDKTSWEGGLSFAGVSEGKFLWPNGDVYVGPLQDGQKHGRGVLNYSDGSKYEGEFKNDLREGKGEYTFANGTKYKGSFKADQFHGDGMFISGDGTRHEGIWTQGKLTRLAGV